MPDIGVSKDALRNVVGLAGEFVGTTDTQTITNKTWNTTDNTLTATSQAAGDILKNNGTKFVRLARGSANQPLKVNSGGTDLDYGTLPVAGGGTGAATLTGIVKASGTSAFTAVAAPTGALVGDSDTQNFTSGGKTFFDQIFKLRNPANTQTLTLRNPIFTSSADTLLDEDYDYIVFIDPGDSNKIKAKGGSTRAIEFNHATDLGNVLSSIHGSLSSTSGGTVKIKSGTYGWNTQLAITKRFVGLHADPGVRVVVTSGFATDIIKVDHADFSIKDFYWDATAMANGTGSWLTIGGTSASDRPIVFHNVVLNAPTSCLVVGANCNGIFASHNYFSSQQSPTGNGMSFSSSADHKVFMNHVGGYANATLGIGMNINACANSQFIGNEIFTNRQGVSIYLPARIIFTHNLIQSNQQHGIVVKNDTATNYFDSIISDNSIINNGTSLSNTYDGIIFSLSSSGVISNLTMEGNTIRDTSVGSKKQRYGININSNLLTDSTIAFNACAGNLTGAINRGTIATTLKVFCNTGDTIPYSFQDFQEHLVVSAPSDPATGFVRTYAKQIDSNNDGLFCKTKINGAVVEVQIV